MKKRNKRASQIVTLVLISSTLSSCMKRTEEAPVTNNATKVTDIVIQIGKLAMLNPEQLTFMLNVLIEDPIEIFVEGEDIVLRKYQPACIFCNEATDITQFEGKNVCKKCLAKIKKL